MIAELTKRPLFAGLGVLGFFAGVEIACFGHQHPFEMWIRHGRFVALAVDPSSGDGGSLAGWLAD